MKKIAIAISSGNIPINLYIFLRNTKEHRWGKWANILKKGGGRL